MVKRSTGRVYLIAGGKWHTFESIVRAIFIDRGIAHPKVVYSGIANDENHDFFAWAKAACMHAGARSVVHAHSRMPARALKAYQNADIIFVSGGDVEIGMQGLTQRGWDNEFKKMYQAGTDFIGVSAGSIMLTNAWVRWPHNDEGVPRIFKCLGLAPVYCDTHDEPRWEELAILLELLRKPSCGYGLCSGSAGRAMGSRIVNIAGSITVVQRKAAAGKSRL